MHTHADSVHITPTTITVYIKASSTTRTLPTK